MSQCIYAISIHWTWSGHRYCNPLVVNWERGDLSGIHWPQVTTVWWPPAKFSRESPDLVTSTGVPSGPLTYNGEPALGGAHLGPESVVVVSEYIVKDFNKFQVYSSPFLPYPRLRDSPPVIVYCNCHEFLTRWTRNGKPSKLGHGWTGPHQRQWSTIKSFALTRQGRQRDHHLYSRRISTKTVSYQFMTHMISLIQICRNSVQRKDPFREICAVHNIQVPKSANLTWLREALIEHW